MVSGFLRWLRSLSFYSSCWRRLLKACYFINNISFHLYFCTMMIKTLMWTLVWVFLCLNVKAAASYLQNLFLLLAISLKSFKEKCVVTDWLASSSLFQLCNSIFYNAGVPWELQQYSYCVLLKYVSPFPGSLLEGWAGEVVQLWKEQQPNFILCLSWFNCCCLPSTQPLAPRPVCSSGNSWIPWKPFIVWMEMY